MWIASLILSWKVVEAQSKMFKHSSEQRVGQLVENYVDVWKCETSYHWFALSNQHFVTHFKFNFVLCIIQHWRWQKNCRDMFLRSVIHFLEFVTYLFLPRQLQIPSKTFGIKMLMKIYLCFHCLENVSSQLWYRALSRVASMVRKRLLFHYDIILLHMKWMCQTH